MNKLVKYRQEMIKPKYSKKSVIFNQSLDSAEYQPIFSLKNLIYDKTSVKILSGWFNILPDTFTILFNKKKNVLKGYLLKSAAFTTRILITFSGKINDKK